MPRLAALVLLALAAGVAPVGAQFSPDDPYGQETPGDYPYDEPGDEAPGPDAYDEALRPHGSWQTDPGYGRFWRPGVAAGWQPYRDGQWLWTRHGWTWASYEPWSWTFHYGRWAFLPTWGWSWFPGSVWGPAWVNWASYGGYVGWAPLSPWGRPPFRNYLFVRDYDFCARHLRHRVFHHHRVPHHVRAHWRAHEGRRPDRHAIERVSRHPVRVLRDRPEQSLAPWHRDRARRARPDGPLVHERRDRDPHDRGSDHLPAERPGGRDHAAPPRDHGRQPTASRDAADPALRIDRDAAARRPRRQPRLGLHADDRPRVDRAERPRFPQPQGVARPPLVRERPAPRQDGARTGFARPTTGRDARPMPPHPPAARASGRGGADGRGTLVHRRGGNAGGRGGGVPGAGSGFHAGR